MLMPIHLKLNLELSPPDLAAEVFLSEYTGTVVESETNNEVGKVRAFFLNADGCERNDQDPVEALDSRSETAPYVPMLSIQDEGNFTPTVLRALGLRNGDMVISLNMLIIDRVELLPSARGRGYGIQAMHLLLSHLTAGCVAAVIKPYPLQFEAKRQWRPELELASFKSSKSEASARLRTHYSKLGFKPMGRSLMILNLMHGYPGH